MQPDLVFRNLSKTVFNYVEKLYDMTQLCLTCPTYVQGSAAI